MRAPEAKRAEDNERNTIVARVTRARAREASERESGRGEHVRGGVCFSAAGPPCPPHAEPRRLVRARAVERGVPVRGTECGTIRVDVLLAPSEPTTRA